MRVTKNQLKRIVKEVIMESRINVQESEWVRKEDYRGEVTLTKEWTKGGETLVKFYVKETSGSSYYGYGPGFSISAYTNLDTGLYQGHLWYWSANGRAFQSDGPRKQFIHESEQVAMIEAEKFIKYMKSKAPEAFIRPGPSEDMMDHDWVHDGYV